MLTGVSGSSSATVYQDTTQLADYGPLSTRNLTTPYVIGTQGTINGEYSSGDIAAVVVYNRALSSAEISQDVNDLLQSSAVPEPTSLILGCVGALGAILMTRKWGTSR